MPLLLQGSLLGCLLAPSAGLRGGQLLPRAENLAAGPDLPSCSPAKDKRARGGGCNPRAVFKPCLECLQPAFQEHPISDEMRRRAEYLGDDFRLHRLMTKMADPKKPILIDVLGGSFTYGHGLGTNRTSLSIAGRLQSLLGDWGNVTVRNMAHRGCGTLCWLHNWRYWEQTKENPPDLLVLDMAINDQMYGSKYRPAKQLGPLFEALIARAASLPNSPALLFAETFRTALSNGREVDGHCPGGNHSTKTARGKILWCPHWWGTADLHTEVLRRYQIPYWSYRDEVWPVESQPPTELGKYWHGLSHADRIAHYLVADGVAAMLGHYNANACATFDITREEPDLPKADEGSGVCFSPETNYVAEMGVEHFPRTDAVAGSSAWRFRQDVRGKPGWIAELEGPQLSPPEESLRASFSVNVTATGRIIVQFLQSYHMMGKVALFIDADQEPVTIIDGFSEECYSIVETKVVDLGREIPLGMHSLTFKLLPSASEDITRSASRFDVVRGNKFKLLSLVSC